MGWLVGHMGLCARPGVPWETPRRMGVGCRGGLVATHSHSWLTWESARPAGSRGGPHPGRGAETGWGPRARSSRPSPGRSAASHSGSGRSAGLSCSVVLQSSHEAVVSLLWGGFPPGAGYHDVRWASGVPADPLPVLDHSLHPEFPRGRQGCGPVFCLLSSIIKRSNVVGVWGRATAD